jgi:hypothetical protein
MLQALGELGGHMGIGAALVFATIAVLEEAEEVWVVAAAPVRARTTTKARTMFFMTGYPKSCISLLSILVDRFDRLRVGSFWK